MNKNAIIYIAGHNGLVGSAILKKLKEKGYTNLIIKSRHEVDLLNQQEVARFFENEKPEYIFLAAAKVGGIQANNTYRADFIYENLMIQSNVIHNAYLNNVRKLLFLGSTCIYPKDSPQPIKEEYLLTDTLEYTNEPYAIAKIAGIKMCESYNLQYDTNFVSVQPTNVYGPNDNFDLEKSHVLPALIRKMHLGKSLENNNWNAIKKDLDGLPIEEITGTSSNASIQDILCRYGVKINQDKTVEVEIWGSGNPLREFLHVEDLSDACIYIMNNVDFKDIVAMNLSTQLKINSAEDSSPSKPEIRNTHINIGTGMDISIKELAKSIKQTVGFRGNLVFNTEKPDGSIRKLSDCSKLHSFGWRHGVELEIGIKNIYNWYLSNH